MTSTSSHHNDPNRQNASGSVTCPSCGEPIRFRYASGDRSLIQKFCLDRRCLLLLDIDPASLRIVSRRAAQPLRGTLRASGDGKYWITCPNHGSSFVRFTVRDDWNYGVCPRDGQLVEAPVPR